jgi:glycosyltransferase involved in cell wall biosynthesis
VHIVHYIDGICFEHGGPVRAIIDLSEAMTARGHSVTVLANDIKDAPASWNTDPTKPKAVLLPPPAMGPLMAKGQLTQAKEIIAQADVFHAHGIWVPITGQMARIAESVNTPYVVSIRGMLDDWCMAQRGLKKKVYLALAGSRLLNRAAKIHLTAQAEYDQARKHFTAPGVVIPNLMDLTPFEQMPGLERAAERFKELLEPGVPVLLFLSRIHYKKGIESLLDASADLCGRGIPHRVLIAGSGDDGYVRTLHEHRDRVGAVDAHFIGQVIGADKISLYQLAELMVLPTSSENFGFVFFEALAAATPVLTTKGVDTWPEIQASGGGHIVPDAEPVHLANTIATLLSDRTSLREGGIKARDWMFKEMNPNILAERFETLYQDALGR